jgi:hypothetical protein
MPTLAPRFWRRDKVIDAYRRLIGNSTLYRVLALFRSAIVFLQLFDRWRRDPGSNVRYAGYGRWAPITPPMWAKLGRELLGYAVEIARGRMA